ncbi:MAG: hypothetical protein VX733_08885 [Candidatus Latescibacterota bacterium]|nr:hypothetical protein [Candidatus Latescibacterota bacterium]
MFLYLDDGFCALQMERNLFHVEHDCTGEFWLCIFLVTIMIYPAPWIAKLRGFLLGISSFFAYGVLRVTGLGLIGHLAPSWVGFFHIYLMVVLNLGFLLFLWTFYVNRWAFSVTPKS